MAEGNLSRINRYVSHNPSHLVYLSSLLGMTRTFIALPLQHPWDVIRVNFQANSHLKNEFAVVRMIKAEKGLKGFYSGYATNCTKQMFKSSYRYPLISGLPRFYAGLFGSNYEKHKYKMKLLTSATVALVEAGLITPFERLQVFIMTSKYSNKNYKDFYHMSKSKLRQELFRGYTPYFTKQIVSWTAFLQADTFYKSHIRRIYNIPDDQMILGYKLALCTFLVSCTTIFCVMPFDNIKTFLQKYNLEMKEGKKVEKDRGQLGIRTAIKRIYAKSGILGFVVGWRIKLCLHFLNSSFTVALLEWLDNLSRQAYN